MSLINGTAFIRPYAMIHPDAQRPDTVWLTVPDGYKLCLTYYLATRPRAVLVLYPAMGILQRYYRSFAESMTQQGFSVVTYDYSGVGTSAPLRLTPGLEAGFSQLASDAGHVMTHVCQAFPALPLGVIGHSIGGLFPLMTPHNHLIRAYLMVGTQVAHSADFGPGRWSRMKTRALWFGVLPLLTRCFGYFPGQRFRTGLADMPAHFVYELNLCRRYGALTDFLARVNARDHHHSLTCRLLALAATDDPICTERAMNRLREQIPGALLEERRIRPAEVGGQAIGHIRFFSRAFARTLWPLAADRFNREFPADESMDTVTRHELVHRT